MARRILDPAYAMRAMLYELRLQIKFQEFATADELMAWTSKAVDDDASSCDDEDSDSSGSLSDFTHSYY